MGRIPYLTRRDGRYCVRQLADLKATASRLAVHCFELIFPDETRLRSVHGAPKRGFLRSACKLRRTCPATRCYSTQAGDGFG